VKGQNSPQQCWVFFLFAHGEKHTEGDGEEETVSAIWFRISAFSATERRDGHAYNMSARAKTDPLHTNERYGDLSFLTKSLLTLTFSLVSLMLVFLTSRFLFRLSLHSTRAIFCFVLFCMLMVFLSFCFAFVVLGCDLVFLVVILFLLFSIESSCLVVRVVPLLAILPPLTYAPKNWMRRVQERGSSSITQAPRPYFPPHPAAAVPIFMQRGDSTRGACKA
jgi:hypothetical protein